MAIPEVETYEATCVICGTVFQGHRRWKQHQERSTCSLECMGKFSHLRRKGLVPAVLEEMRKCEECGASFLAHRKTAKMRFSAFCSKACIGKYRSKQMRDKSWHRQRQQTCTICAKSFLAVRTRKDQRFRTVCSHECQAAARSTMLKRACSHCGATFHQQRSVVQRTAGGGCFCSKGCYNAHRKAHGHRGMAKGRKIDKGYVLVYAPEHPKARGGYVYEHRLVMETMLGRLLRKGENVHHIDGKRGNNDPSNLELWSSGQPAGQRMSDLERIAAMAVQQEVEILKQRIADLEAELASVCALRKE